MLAPQKEFESPTFRLGGGRSILLSYWGISLAYSIQKWNLCQLKKGREGEKKRKNTVFLFTEWEI